MILFHNRKRTCSYISRTEFKLKISASVEKNCASEELSESSVVEEDYQGNSSSSPQGHRSVPGSQDISAPSTTTTSSSRSNGTFSISSGRVTTTDYFSNLASKRPASKTPLLPLVRDVQSSQEDNSAKRPCTRLTIPEIKDKLRQMFDDRPSVFKFLGFSHQRVAYLLLDGVKESLLKSKWLPDGTICYRCCSGGGICICPWEAETVSIKKLGLETLMVLQCILPEKEFEKHMLLSREVGLPEVHPVPLNDHTVGIYY